MARKGAYRDSPSPFVIDTRRLGVRPGSTLTVQRTVPFPASVGAALVAITDSAPVDLDLRLESVSEGVLVTGSVSAPTSAECARCLTPISGRVDVELTELYAYPDSATEASTEDDEIGHVVDDSIDLEQPIIDAIGLALPFSPLCSPDCQGLCPDCGVPLATAEPGHGHEKLDPRWAKLAAMRVTEPAESDGTDPAGDPR
jgi:uncharacterized protein